MKIFILSTGANLGLAYHLTQEGHTVNSSYSTGNVTFVTPPDIYITDPLADPKFADILRNKGVKVLGVDSWTRLMESDDSYNHAFARALGYEMSHHSITGTRVTVSCLFNGNTFISKMLVFPYKRMMSCDVGIEIDCSGYLAYFDVAKSKLVNDTLEPLEKFLKKAAHHGNFSIDCVINKDGIYVENVSAGMSKAYITAIYENTRLKKSDVILRTCDANSKEIPHSDPWAAGVSVSISPYPHLIPKKSELVNGFNPLNLKHFWLVDVAQDGENWLVGANSGCLGYVTSRGVSIQEVSRRVYRTLSNITVEGIQYRGDIGKDVFQKFSRLKEYQLV